MGSRFLCLVLEMMKSVYSRGEYSDVLQILLLLGVFAMSFGEKRGEFQRLWLKCRRFLVPCLVRVFSECENEVEMMMFVA